MQPSHLKPLPRLWPRAPVLGPRRAMPRELGACAEMSVVASKFQAVLDVVRVWRRESFEALKVNGQHALCEQERDYETLAYVSKYCSK